jgi:MoaA/NifB/PqqE/SkfB family radical SAM enzyme
MPEQGRKSLIKELLDKSYQDCFPYLPPVRLDISLTTACNTRCAYCWQQEKSGSKLSFDNVAGIIKFLCLQKPPKLNFTGGEPTVFPDFERLLEYANKSGISSILLCTNGYRLQDYSFAERIVNLGVTALNISVDTLDSAKFEILRGYKFSEFHKALDNCLKLKKEHPGLYVTLASVMSKMVSPEELSEVERFCLKNKLGYFMQSFDKTIYPQINKRFALSAAERQNYAARLSWLKGRVGEVVRRPDNPLTRRGGPARCYKGITTVKLSSDGSIRFCWKGKPIGNILESPFIEIWNSPAAEKTREFIRDKKCECDFDCDVFESLELLD